MRKLWFILISALALILASCERRPLEYYYRPTCRVILNVDWSNFPEIPTGMSAYFFRDGDNYPIVATTSEIYSTEVDLPVGHFRCFVMNQTPEEFWTYSFMNMNDFSTAEATLTMTKSGWYKSKVSRAGIDPAAVAVAPEDLGIALIDEFEITEEMVDDYQALYADWKTKTKAAQTKGSASDDSTKDAAAKAKVALDGATYHIYGIAYNVVCELNVKVHIQNIYNLYSARASMDGLADGFLISADRASDNETVQLMDSDVWSKHIDDIDPTKGYVEGRVRTLGLPGSISGNLALRDPNANIFNFSCQLVDRTTTRDFEFKVGNKFNIEMGVHGINLVLDLELGTWEDPDVVLPDVPPAGGDGGGFDVNVDEWEQGETVEIPM